MRTNFPASFHSLCKKGFLRGDWRAWRPSSFFISQFFGISPGYVSEGRIRHHGWHRLRIVELKYEIMEKALIDTAKTVLVIIDLQKGIAGRRTAPHESGTVVKNAAALAEAFRKKGMPVFLVRVTPSADRKDALHPLVDAPVQFQNPAPDWADIVPEIGPKPGDFVITKRQWGAFYGTELDLQLRRRGMATIVLCGISTNIGVESTARFAYEYGYNQVFAEDAMAALSAEEHTSTVTKIFPRIGLVRKTKDILADLSPN